MQRLFFLTLAFVGCVPDPPRAAPVTHLDLADVALPRVETLPGDGFERIEVTNGEVAWVSTPAGALARDKRPVFVGVHGAGDRADWACSAWKQATADHAIIVCPQSPIAHPEWKDTFVWRSAGAVDGQAGRAVDAVRARYGAWMQDGPLVYGGWSQGGTLAAQAVAVRPGTFDRVVLVEVGHTPLDADQVSAAFATAGVKRAVVACESAKCRSFAQRFEASARRRRLASRTSDAGLRHHWFDEPVYRSLAPQLVWLVEDDPRFAGLGAAVEAKWLTD